MYNLETRRKEKDRQPKNSKKVCIITQYQYSKILKILKVKAVDAPKNKTIFFVSKKLLLFSFL